MEYSELKLAEANIQMIEKYLIAVLYFKPWYVKFFTFWPEDFSNLGYRKIFESLLTLKSDEAMPYQHLLADNCSAIVIASFADLVEEATLANPVDFKLIAERLRENTIKTKLDSRFKQAKNSHEIFELAHELEATKAGTKAASLAMQYADYKHNYVQQKDQMAEKCTLGLITGWNQFDELVYLQPGDYSIIGARTSVGKTMFALNLAHNVARFNQSVCYVNLEMGEKQIMDRILAISTDKPISDYKYLKSNLAMADNEVKSIGPNMNLINGFNLKSTDLKSLVIGIPSLKLLIVDYIALLADEQNKTEGMNGKLTRISHTLQGLARQLNCVVIAISQLNRDSSKANRQPELYDLRDSGSLEQDATQVILLHRIKPEGKDKLSEATDIVVAKNRTGELGSLNFWLNSQTGIFKEMEKE